MSEEVVYLKAVVVRKQEDVYSLRLVDGFSSQEITAHRGAIISVDPVAAKQADDLVRLPLLLAAVVTKRLREHGPAQREWLQQSPNQLLERLEQEATALRAAIKRDGSRVLDSAADVALAALMLADKADKLEPMPELIDSDAVEA